MIGKRSEKGHTRKYMFFFYFRLKLEPEILNCQIFSAVLSRITHLYLPDSNK